MYCMLTGRSSFEPRHATLVTVSSAAAALDPAIAPYLPAPNSYTGEDVVERSAHGSPVVLAAIVAAAVAAGARLANPGEFTLRAYLHARIDLVQAEAVAELIDAVTPLQARVAFDQLEGTLTSRLGAMDAALLEIIAPLEASLDFRERVYHFVAPSKTAETLGRLLASLEALLADAKRGRLIREGVTAAIVGRPNVGKSSLFNRLAGAARAIVTAVARTRRVWSAARVDVGGVPFTIVDTAGRRQLAGDAIEEEGISRARQAGPAADIAILVLDRSAALTDDDRSLLDETAGRARVIVASKSDLAPEWDAAHCDAIPVSSLTDEGIADLRAALLRAGGIEVPRDRAPIANIRHVALLEQAHAAIARAAAAAAAKAPEELLLADLHEARGRFDEITGARPQDEVLRVIFERFCIGKYLMPQIEVRGSAIFSVA